MNVLILGADGFVGRHVAAVMSGEHEVYGATRDKNSIDGSTVYVDLLRRKTIAKALESVMPQVIVNCAGVVDNSEAAMQNPVFTTNLLQEVALNKGQVRRIIVSGSAAEYGVVSKENIPVKEDVPLNATAGYGLSKLQETSLALKYANEYDLPVTVARIFNPIGKGMHERFLIPRIIQQVHEFQQGQRQAIEVSRLDSKRDYIHIADVAQGIKALCEGAPRETIYNIGSGVSTSNEELINFILNNSDLTAMPEIVETSADEEPLVAIQADITRLQQEFGWHPVHSIEETVKEIMYGTE